MDPVTVSLEKGQKVDLTKAHPDLKVANVGLGWDVNASGGQAFDLDAFAILLQAGKLPSAKHIIYFSNLTGFGVSHTGDNLTGDGDGDDETLKFDLSTIPSEIDEIMICVNIFKADERGRQNFGQVKNAFIRVYNSETNQELIKYDLNEDYSAFNGMIMGKLYRKDGDWKFQAIGEGRSGDINAMAAPYRP